MATIAFDPQQLAIDSIAGEAALDAVRLTPDWLRQRRFAGDRVDREYAGVEQQLGQVGSGMK